MGVSDLEPLLDLQERDLALDRLRHRREVLPERDALRAAETQAASLESDLHQLRDARDEVAREERKHDDEAQALGTQATTAERRLYSGEVSSPRELQALQADVEQLRRHQRAIEDNQLATMERREPLDEQVKVLERDLETTTEAVANASAGLAAAEAEIDAAIEVERAAREALASGLPSDLVTEYERCREKANGIGAARLIGGTCQGCHLTIPATEVDRIRKAAPGVFAHCDNCGCILVP